MTPPTITVCNVSLTPSLKLWPFTEDTNFSRLQQRQGVTAAECEKGPFLIRQRFIYLGELLHLAGVDRAAAKEWYRADRIANNKKPEDVFLGCFKQLLEREVVPNQTIVWWEYPYFMYREFVQLAKDAHCLVVAENSDDTIESIFERGVPAASALDVYLYAAPYYDWDNATSLIDLYKKEGAKDLRFRPLLCSIPGYAPHIVSADLFNEKWQKIRNGELKPTFSFVGNFAYGSVVRRDLLTDLNTRAAEEFCVETRLHGIGMRDNPYPCREYHDKTQAVQDLYAETTFGVTVPYQSLLNNRLYDQAVMGVTQCLYDPHNEVQHVGFTPNVHFAPFDGTFDGLNQCIEDLTKDLQRAEDLARAAHQQISAVMRPYVYEHEPIRSIVSDYWDRITG